MNQEMIWQEISREAYKQQEKRLPRLPLLQSADYGEAAAKFYGHIPHYWQGSKGGLCMFHTAQALGGLLQAVMCDRGPVIADEQSFVKFLEEFNRRYSKRFGRKRRLIPETPGVEKIMKSRGFKKQSAGYETLWIDCAQDSDTLRAALKKNWRAVLTKAEKSSLEIAWDETGQTFPLFLKNYQLDKQQKDYAGPSVSFIKALAGTFAASGNLLIGSAVKDGKTIAGILILCHGRAATYQAGWSDEAGRSVGAHHLLLWQALSVLKNRDISDFDLGGINDECAKGVKQFKSGMGGDLVRLPGLFV